MPAQPGAGARSDADSKPLFIAGRDDWLALAARMGVSHALRIDADGRRAQVLLGADDKAGIAEILDALTRIHENPDFRHGPVKVAFTPDEEVGGGIEKFEIEDWGAKFAYTVDGEQLGDISNAVPSADGNHWPGMTPLGT